MPTPPSPACSFQSPKLENTLEMGCFCADRTGPSWFPAWFWFCFSLCSEEPGERSREQRLLLLRPRRAGSQAG